MACNPGYASPNQAAISATSSADVTTDVTRDEAAASAA